MKKTMILLMLSMFLIGCGKNGADTGTVETTETVETIEEKSVSEIYEEIAEAVDLPVMVTLTDDYISNYYGVNLELLEEYLFTNAEEIIYADTIILMKAKDETSVGELQEILETIITQKKLELENYLPDQFKIVEKSKVETSGTYVYLVISDERNTILEIIEKYIK